MAQSRWAPILTLGLAMAFHLPLKSQEVAPEGQPSATLPAENEPLAGEITKSAMGRTTIETALMDAGPDALAERKQPLRYLMGRWREMNPEPEVPSTGPATFGVAGIRVFADGNRMAPNGYEFTPIGDLTLNFNLWLLRKHHVYLFADTDFWMQKAAPGITNSRQGSFDFSKREFDYTLGLAWNYWGAQELRLSAYSLNNLNRGKYRNKPWGFADGTIIENRWYLGGEYSLLGTEDYDIARANFLAAGYMPTKELLDNMGERFKPGPFIRAYLTGNILSSRHYLYTDTQLIGNRSFELSLLQEDCGLAFRPFKQAPRAEFRFGVLVVADTQNSDTDASWYGQFRIVY